MDDTSQQLPLKANKGYCYFDVNTGKWWVDIAGNGTQNAITSETTDTGFNRMPLNAYKSDIAILAYAAKNATYEVTVAGGGKENRQVEIASTFGTQLNFTNNILTLSNLTDSTLSQVSFGALASVNSVSGTYTPAGSISQGIVTITPSTDTVSKLTTNGSVPTLSTSVANEVLSFNFSSGSMPSFSGVEVLTGCSATVSAQTFTGSEATITLSPVTGGAQNGDNIYF